MTFLTEKERKKELKTNIENYMKLLFRKSVEEANPQQMFQAVAYAVKDIVVDDWMATHKAYEKKDVKTVYYLSMEFLMGRAMGNMIINLKEDKMVREVLDEMGIRHMAAESVINTVCSNRRSKMDSRLRHRMTGSKMAIHLR